jgi:hypothetical protein
MELDQLYKFFIQNPSISNKDAAEQLSLSEEEILKGKDKLLLRDNAIRQAEEWLGRCAIVRVEPNYQWIVTVIKLGKVINKIMDDEELHQASIERGQEMRNPDISDQGLLGYYYLAIDSFSKYASGEFARDKYKLNSFLSNLDDAKHLFIEDYPGAYDSRARLDLAKSGTFSRVVPKGKYKTKYSRIKKLIELAKNTIDHEDEETFNKHVRELFQGVLDDYNNTVQKEGAHLSTPRDAFVWNFNSSAPHVEPNWDILIKDDVHQVYRLPDSLVVYYRGYKQFYHWPTNEVLEASIWGYPDESIKLSYQEHLTLQRAKELFNENGFPLPVMPQEKSRQKSYFLAGNIRELTIISKGAILTNLQDGWIIFEYKDEEDLLLSNSNSEFLVRLMIIIRPSENIQPIIDHYNSVSETAPDLEIKKPSGWDSPPPEGKPVFVEYEVIKAMANDMSNKVANAQIQSQMYREQQLDQKLFNTVKWVEKNYEPDKIHELILEQFRQIEEEATVTLYKPVPCGPDEYSSHWVSRKRVGRPKKKETPDE